MKEKDLKVKAVGRGYQVFYKGERCKYIGSGISRRVYKTPDEQWVVKVEDTSFSEQTQDEYANYKRLKRRIPQHLPVTKKPFSKEGLLIGLQEYIPGKKYNSLRGKVRRSVKDQYTHLEEKTGVSDLHGGNLVYNEKRGCLVIVDLGDGV